ncbi:MAG: haloacid dehalogenase-like hydrolase [Clostridia bacterium]|nr:haloacid dehalogenase-like hydrolase [Clostridia bacterium]
MNVYDFDRTLFPGDSSMHFWAFCKKRYPKIWLHFPGGITKMGFYKLGFFTWGEVMEKFFTFMKYLPNKEAMIEEFWDKKVTKIYPWYKERQKEDDIIISATPYFIIRPIALRLGIKNVIATDMDINTYKINGLDCTGIQKVVRFKEEYGDAKIDEFYSDSYSDMPLAEIAEKAYMIGKHGEITDWDFTNKKGQKKSDKITKRYTKLAWKKARKELQKTEKKLFKEEKQNDK